MPLLSDNETNGASFIWTLQNYKHRDDEEDDSIASPSFVLKTTTSEDTFDLVLTCMKNSWHCPQYVSLWLRLKASSVEGSKRTVHFALSVLSEGDNFMKKQDMSRDFLPSDYHGHLLLRREDLFEKDVDTLTFRCRIWQIDDQVLASSRCYARTLFGGERTFYRWSMGGSSPGTVLESQPISAEVPFLNINIKKIGEYPIEIKRTASERKCLCICEISSLVDGEEEPQLTLFEHWFEKSAESEQLWIPQFDPTTKIVGHKRTSFECRVVASTGVNYSMVERVEYGEIKKSVCAKEQEAESNKNPEVVQGVK